MRAADRFGWQPEGASGIELVDEAATDTARFRYRHVEDYSDRHGWSSAHGLVVDGEHVALFANAGGATGVHECSAVYVDERLYVAVGNRIVCVRARPYALLWSTVVDDATCFGVHYDRQHDALISHGELAIVRFSDAGRIVWTASGADIFSGPLALRERWIEAIDFDGKINRFEYADGIRIAG